MSQQPKTETDRLANVIQVLQLGQKTGRLIAERNEGPQFEQGIITFVSGQVVQANLNQIQGPEAFSRLKNWGMCRFAFTPDQSIRTNGRLPTSSLRSSPAKMPQPPGWRETGQHTQSTSPLYNRAPGTAPLPGQIAGPIYPQENIYNRTTHNLGGEGQSTPPEWLATPYRTRHMEEGMRLIEQMGLSRTHRRLFLLIDGGRTVKELIRLMSHDPADVQRLLQDLARAGVVQV
ncbi:MAG TPA: DUF4388 domain-containing protein [Ktedonobacteraceae bacterium]|jgi:hypothetical protein